MSSRLVIYGALVAAIAGGGALMTDLLVESDDERIEELADALADGSGAERVLRWSDPEVATVSVSDRSARTERFRDGDEADLSDAVHDALSPLDGSNLDVVQRTVRVDGDRALIAMRARADGDTVDATVALARDGQRWLVTSVQVR
ncbi:MAG: hypothetical protein AB7S26_19425 [Sandaracinaceae bacterium]